MRYLNCICCGRSLEDICEYQPDGGTAFHTYGHYGSAVTDHMDGTVTTVFVCDLCMKRALTSRVAREDKPNDSYD